MLPYRTLLPLLTFFTLLCGTSSTHFVVAAEDETRIVAGLRSADVLIDELQHIVSKIAERDESYQNNIYPNIEIFLIGVDTAQPVRFDPIFSEQHGMELQPLIPHVDLDEFLEDNLDPIGIIPKRDRRDRELHELTGNVYEGWLRVLSDPAYVVIFKRKEAIPKGMPHPAELHKELVQKGYSLFAHLDNTKSEPVVRQSAFAKMVKNTVEGIQKRPDETQNGHELRKVALNQQLNLLQQWFVEGKELTVGSKLDKQQDAALFEMMFSALAETQLQKDIHRVRTEPSYFASLKGSDKALLKARVHFMFDERTAQGLREVYKLTETVAQEEIAEDSKLSEEDKKSRSTLAGLLNQVMTKSSELKVLDAFIDVVPAGAVHAFVMGVRCDGQAQIEAMIDEVLANRKEMKLTKNVVEVEGISLHKLDLGDKAPAALKELYGTGYDTVYLAASDKAFWLAFGEDAQKELTSRIQAVRTASDPKSDNVVFSMTAKAAPLVKSLNGLLKDEESLIGSFFSEQNAKRDQRKKKADEEKEKKKEGDEEDRPAREAASNFLTFDWVDKVLGSMEGEDDTVIMEMKVNAAGEIVGNSQMRKGILRAVGVMIANFADENLQ